MGAEGLVEDFVVLDEEGVGADVVVVVFGLSVPEDVGVIAVDRGACDIERHLAFAKFFQHAGEGFTEFFEATQLSLRHLQN